MRCSWLKTKLFIPKEKPGLVPRERLLMELNAGLLREWGFARKTTLVSAPPGYGKTTVVGQWAQQFVPRVAWLTLDEDDNHPVSFMQSLMTAIRAVVPDACGVTWDSIHSKAIVPGQSLDISKETVILFTNDLLEIQEPLLIVLDDYQSIGNVSIHKLLASAIESLPAKIHLVVSTRTDPPWPLHRWRVTRDLLELRQKDLLMSKDEAQQLFREFMDDAVSDQDIALLLTKTEGWPASLQMAALSMQGAQDIPQFIERFTGNSRYVLDYFTDEVLKGQRDEVKEFLLKTSVLDSMTAGLCNYVLDWDNSQELLEELEKTNLFIIPKDDFREWYRYHALFTELLRVNLARVYPDTVELLYRKACHWYIQQNIPEVAIAYAFKLSDNSLAVSLLAGNIEQLWASSGALKVNGWLEQLDPHVVEQNLKLKLFGGIVRVLAGEFSEAEAIVDQVKQTLDGGCCDSEQTEQAEIIGLAGIIGAYIAKFRGDVDEIVACSAVALQHLPQGQSFFRPGVAVVSGDAYLIAGEVGQAKRRYADAIWEGKQTGSHFFVQLAYISLAYANWITGSLLDTEAICEEHSEFAQSVGMEQTPRAGVTWALLGDVLRERNKADLALEYVQKGCALSGSETLVQILSKLCLSRVHMSLNNMDAAYNVLIDLDRILRDIPDVLWYEQLVQSLIARIRIRQDAQEALTELERYSTFELEGVKLLNVPMYLVRARALSCVGEIRGALDILEQVYAVARKKKIISWMIEAQLLRALTYFSAEGIDSARECLKESLRMGEREGYVRIFLDEGPAMQDLLQNGWKENIFPGYSKRLLSQFSVAEKNVRSSARASSLVEHLSDREVEILSLISQGKSNQEIASQLYLSLNTVKWHASNIFGKLAVQNRTEAVAKAKQELIIG